MSIERASDDDDLRWYSDGEGVECMSVTTILDVALDEDTSGLEFWRNNIASGKGDKPHWEHIYWYSAPRGTLCHYQALKKFEDSFDGDDMWGPEESESMSALMSGPSTPFEEASESLDDIAYSILKDQGRVEGRAEYDHTDTPDLMQIAQDDIQYFVDKFSRICHELGITEESVIRVEQMVLDGELQYGGQTDLVYEDPNGDIVCADLKTSSSLRHKHRLQIVAYGKAVERSDWGPDEVDRLEVIRISPTKREFQVHSHEVPEHAAELDWYTDNNWLSNKYNDFEYESTEAMWEKFKELAEQAHEMQE